MTSLVYVWVWFAGKQSQALSSVGSDALLSSSSASPVKVKSPLVVTNTAVFSPPVASLVPASGSSGAFQMCRYMSDNSDNLRRNSAPEGTEAGNVDQVDSSVLETFDPLGYAQNSIPQANDVEFDVDIITKEVPSDLFVERANDGDNPSVLSTGSSASLVDISVTVSTHVDVIATGSSISLDTLTGCVRDAASLHMADSSESLDGQIGKRHTSANQAANESGARPAAAGSVQFFPPRISISHLSDGSVVQVKPLLATGKQSSGPVEPVDDGCSADHGSVGRNTAFQVVQSLSAKPAARSAGTSTVTTSSVIESASGLLTSRVGCSLSAFK